MTKIKLASWNINSVRLRINTIADYVKLENPDILALQEIKCQNEEFPIEAFKNMGYDYVSINGQKGFHGVAIASKIPFTETSIPEFCMHGHSRVASININNNILHNLYIPAGGDIPDPVENDKFAHKLDFLSRLENYLNENKALNKIIVGDLNIAPHINDVWSHKALLDVVSHTPIETETLERLRINGEMLDIARLKHGENDKVYSWWSYRAKDWTLGNKGRRLDHIWVSKNLLEKTNIDSFAVYKDTRSWEKPSDHVPISVEIDL